jgi:4-hydroxybenzoyl-CoA reductase subunit beta
MRLPKFSYVEPKTVEAACSILAEERHAKVLAGGTDLLVNMKNRVETPDFLVNLKGVPHLNFIRPDEGGLTIGALTPLKKIYSSREIGSKLPSLTQAASGVGSYHHQVMGTIGGNICQQNRCNYFNQSAGWHSARPKCLKMGGGVCHVVRNASECFSCYHGELAPLLIAMSARVEVQGHENRRVIPIEDLFTGDGETPLALSQGEILTEVRIPAKAVQGISYYIKFADRGSIDFPVVGVAVWALPAEGEYRVCFTAVDRRPVRAKQVEDFLRGQRLDAKVLSQAEELCMKIGRPLRNTAFSPSYKRQVMKHLFNHAIRQVLGGLIH